MSPTEHDSGSLHQISRPGTASETDKSSEPTQRLVTWDEIPTWLQDNCYIRAGYRAPSYSIRASLSSIFYTHTEFVNILSHLFGALALVFLAVPFHQSVSSRYHSFAWQDKLAFGVWFICAILCLGMSATYHVICNHSPIVNAFSQKLDHLGIVILTSGSFLSMIYYGWYCEPKLRSAFSTMVSRAPEFRAEGKSIQNFN
jgi:adiponectin receptor